MLVQSLTLDQLIKAHSQVVKEHPYLEAGGYQTKLTVSRKGRHLSDEPLSSGFRIKAVQAAHLWLAIHKPSSKPRNAESKSAFGSYGLKHRAEGSFVAHHLGINSISNGELILAALILGYPFLFGGVPNIYIGLDYAEYNRLHKIQNYLRNDFSAYWKQAQKYTSIELLRDGFYSNLVINGQLIWTEYGVHTKEQLMAKLLLVGSNQELAKYVT